jgi:hypothetical protein
MKSKLDWRAAYFHLVSLVCIITLIIGAINAGQGILKLAFPVLSMDQYTWERVQSFEAYKRNQEPMMVKSPRPPVPVEDTVAAEAPEPTDEELRKQWQDERGLLIEGQRRRGLWSLVQALVIIVIVLPIFWWHRRATKLLKDNESSQGLKE